MLYPFSFQEINLVRERLFERGMAKSAAVPAPGCLPPAAGKDQKKVEVSKNELLMEAVRRGELTTVRRLVDRSGADVCTVNQYGLSCLQLAIIGGHTKLAEFIIQKGANIHSIDSQGWTALHDAAQMDMKGLVRKLICKGCKVTATTDLGELPIDVAGSVEMEKALCSEMTTRGEGKLAKDYTAYLGLQHMPDPNSRVVCSLTHRGLLPMCCTSSRGNAAPVQMILPNKIHVQLQRRHSSPVHVLQRSSQVRHSPVGKQRSVNIREEAMPNHPEVVETAETQGNQTFCLRPSASSKLQEAVIDRPPLHHDTNRHQYRSTHANINTSRQHGIASVTTASTSNRRSVLVGRNYLRERAELGKFRSSATISAALGVCFDSVATTFWEDSLSKDTLDSIEDSASAEATSTADNSTRKRKISICELSVYHMARTKIASGSSPVATAEKERAALALSEEARRERQDLENDEAFKRPEGEGEGVGKGVSAADEGGSNGTAPYIRRASKEAVANLKRLPRKPSIISPARRRSSADAGNRRRSVTFQPEVLLQEMVLDGDLKAVKEILLSGVLNDINKLSPSGLTALHQSAIDGNLECAKALVANGADVNCVDCELWTPLHAAAMSGRIDIVRFLLTHGASSRLKNEASETAYDVAKTGPIKKLLLCSMNGKSLDADEISDGEYSDEEEKEYSHAESESDDDGEEPCYFDSPKTSHENSASPSPDFGDHSDSVFLNGAAKTVGLSSSSDSSSSTKKSHDPIDGITSCASILDADNHSQSNHFHHSSEETGMVDFVSEDQGISTMDGSSDCSHRSRTLSEDEGTLRDALDSELVPGSLDYRFQEASLYCNVDSLLKFAKYRAEIKVDRVNKSSGITALHHAVLEENFAMVQHLVKDFKADLHIKDRDGWTPLHAASAVGNIRIAQFLLDSGAKASILNNQCEFPVDVAEDKAMEKLLKNVMLGPSIGSLLK